MPLRSVAIKDSLTVPALAHQATLWTQDDDFKDLPHVRYFPKIKVRGRLAHE